MKKSIILKDILRKTGLFFTALFLFSTGAYAQPGFTKSFNPTTIGPGSISTLTFTIDNTASGTPVTDLAFTDNFPAGMTVAVIPGVTTDCDAGSATPTVTANAGDGSISMTGGAVGGNSSCTVTVNVTSSTIGTAMNVSGDLTSSAGNSGTASADLVIDANRPGFSKSFSPANIDKGERSTLTFMFDNTASIVDRVSLNFTDNFPSNMVVANPANASTTCNFASFGSPFYTITANPGASSVQFQAAFNSGVEKGTSCTFSVDVITTQAGNFDNLTGNLSYSGGSSGMAGNILAVNQEILHLTKEFTNDPVSPNGTVDLQFTIKNNSRGTGSTNIAFTDDLDATLSGLVATGLPTSACNGGTLSGTSTISLSGGTLSAGAECSFTVTCQVPSSATAGSYLNETSQITGAGAAATGNTASDYLFIESGVPDPTLTKTFTTATAVAGGTATVDFVITNNDATNDMTGFAFTDNLDAFLSGTTLASVDANNCGATVNGMGTGTMSVSGGTVSANSSCTISVTLQLDAGASAGTYTNTTSTLTGMIDGNGVTGDTASDDLNVAGAPFFTKTFSEETVSAGSTVDITFTIELDENSPTDATNVAFTDNLEAFLTGTTMTGVVSNTCGATVSGTSTISVTGGTVSAGSSCTITVTVQIPAGAATGNHTNTTGTISATVGGINVTGGTASDDLTIDPMVFTKEFIDGPAIPGQSTTLRFTIQNTASTNAASVSFSDNISTMLSGATFDAGSIPADPCGNGATVIRPVHFLLFMVGETIAANSTCTFDVEVIIPAGADNNTYTNQTSNLTSSFGTSEKATANLVVNDELIQLEKEFKNNPYAKGTTSATAVITITNLDGANSLDDVAFTDDLEAFLTGTTLISFSSNNCGTGTFTGEGTSTVSVSGVSLAAGGNCSFEIDLDIPANSASGTHTNTTTVPTGTIGGLAVSGPAASGDMIIEGVSFSKAFGGNVVAGETTTLSFTIENFDATALTDLSFTDDLANVLSGMVVTGALPTDPCGSGSTLTATGNTLIELTGGNLAANTGTCTFQVSVMIPCNAAAGTYTNTTSELRESSNPFVGLTATDDVTVTALTAASIQTCPPTQNVEGCDTGDIKNGGLTALDYSTSEVTITGAQFTAEGGATNGNGTITIKYQDSSTGTCPIVVTRTFTVSDDCGNSGTCSQTINIDDTTDPSITTCPPTRNVEGCDTGDIMNGGHTALAYSTSEVTITSVQFTNEGGAITEACNHTIKYQDSSTGTCPIVITRTFTVTDDCNNSTTCSQTINIDDTTDPVISTCPGNITVEGCGTSEITNGGHTALAYSTSATTITSAQFTTEGGAITEVCGHTITYQDAASGSCPTTVTRTFTVTDDCNNSTTCSQTITIDDTTDPVITTCPGNITVEGCGTSEITNGGHTALAYSTSATTITSAQFTAEGGAITEACNHTITYQDAASGSCPTTVTRTFTVTDDCNNSTTCSQTITIDDTTDPVISTCPGNITVEGCGTSEITNGGHTALAYSTSATTITSAQFTAEGGAITETCNHTITYQDAASGSCPTTVTRTFTVTDDCNNSTTCSQTITIDDTTDPVITTCPGNITVEGCGTSEITNGGHTALAYSTSAVTITSAQFTAEGGAITEACNHTITYQDAASGSCPTTVTRTFTVTDDCNNSTTCSQTITIDDTTDPAITTCPPTRNVEGCDTGDIMNGGLTALAYSTSEVTITATQFMAEGGAITEACTHTIKYQDSSTGTCPIVVTRTFTVTDACNNSTTCSQTINIDDTTDPVITDCPDNITLVHGCGTDDIQIGNHTALAYSETSVTITTAQFAAEGGAVTEICGFNIQYQDVSSGTCPIVVTRTFTVTDDCNNSTTCSQTINIDDVSPPIILSCPPTLTVAGNSTNDITDDGQTSLPYVTSMTTITNAQFTAEGGFIAENCTVATIQYLDTNNGGTCPIIVTRTFFVTDECDNITPCTQIINISNTAPPVINSCPSGFTTEGCTGADVTNGGMTSLAFSTTPVTITETQFNNEGGSATDPDGDIGSVTYQDSEGSGCPLLVTRTFTVTDDCMNSSTCTQTITIDDNVNPTPACNNISVTLSGLGMHTLTTAELAAMGAGSSDNCGGTLSFSAVPNSFDCSNIGSNMVTLTVMDPCGNPASCSATVNVEDDTPPVFTTCPNYSEAFPTDMNNCHATIMFSIPTVSDNCPSVTLEAQITDNNTNAVVTAWTTDPNGVYPPGSYTIMWRATDAGGNQVFCTETFAVVDNQAPTAVCQNATATCVNGSATITPAMVDGGSQDNCGIVNSSVNPMTVSCVSAGTVTVTLTVTDAAGLSDNCTATVTIPGQGTNVTIDDISLPEGDNFGFTFFLFKIERDNNTSTFSFDANTADGTATLADNDYLAANNTHTYVAGGSNIFYNVVLVRKDNTPESNEDFFVNLSSASSIPNFVNTPGTGTIINDDGATLTGPNSGEICDGIDNDNDGKIDEGLENAVYSGNMFLNSQEAINNFPTCISQIEGYLIIIGDEITDLSPLQNLQYISRDLFIGNTSLTSLKGLDNLNTVQGVVKVSGNDQLTTLAGLQTLSFVGDELSIHDNPILTDCCPVSRLLNSGGVKGHSFIYGNNTGCEHTKEVKYGCTDISFDNNGFDLNTFDFEQIEMTVFPNPATDELNVVLNQSSDSGILLITDALGQEVYTEKLIEGKLYYDIEIEQFRRGLYWIMIQNGKEIKAEKVILH